MKFDLCCCLVEGIRMVINFKLIIKVMRCDGKEISMTAPTSIAVANTGPNRHFAGLVDGLTL